MSQGKIIKTIDSFNIPKPHGLISIQLMESDSNRLLNECFQIAKNNRISQRSEKRGERVCVIGELGITGFVMKGIINNARLHSSDFDQTRTIRFVPYRIRSQLITADCLKNMTKPFDVIIEKDSEGYYVASVPALKILETER